MLKELRATREKNNYISAVFSPLPPSPPSLSAPVTQQREERQLVSPTLNGIKKTNASMEKHAAVPARICVFHFQTATKAPGSHNTTKTLMP